LPAATSTIRITTGSSTNAIQPGDCEIADGHRVDDADWKSDDAGHYQVRLDGKWIPVPDAAVINPHDRPIDYAVVWIWRGEILCFMPGSGS